MDGKGMFDVAAAEAMVEKTHGDDTTMIDNSKKLFEVCKSGKFCYFVVCR